MHGTTSDIRCDNVKASAAISEIHDDVAAIHTMVRKVLKSEDKPVSLV